MLNTYLQDCLNRRILFMTGKGGVGKSLVAWATAAAIQRLGKKTGIISWSPFENIQNSDENSFLGIEHISLGAEMCFREYALRVLKFEKVYDVIFDNKILKTFVSVAPGLSETVIAGKIWQLYHDNPDTLWIVDLPASGHAFSFFQSPLGIQKIFSIGFVHKEAKKITELFQSKDTRLDFVAIPEEMSLVETQEFYSKLKQMHPFSFGFLIINQCTPKFTYPDQNMIQTLPEAIRAPVLRRMMESENEQEALSLVENLSLNKIFIPKFALENTASILEKISEALQKG